MKLNVQERLILINLLPPQRGSLTSLRIIRKLREDLSFSEEEHVQLQFHNSGETLPDGTIVPDGQIQWQPIPLEKDVDIGPVALAAIQAAFDQLGKSDGLNEELLSFYDKFAPPEPVST
jgi:hypothetical protein